MVGDVHAPQCNEAYTTIQLPASASRKGTASLHVKVDTRAGGNVLPLHVFRCLYPDQIIPAGLPTGLDHVSTRLTAYNRSYIPLYGALCGPIIWQPDYPSSWPHRVKSYLYVADTPGPAIKVLKVLIWYSTVLYIFSIFGSTLQPNPQQGTHPTLVWVITLRWFRSACSLHPMQG